MVEELKLAIKIDDVSIEQSLLKQFANAQKMADKVVLDFRNVNFDDKQIEAKFKEMQKKAGQNPIDLTIGGNTLDMLGQIDKRLTEILSIGKGKSFIDSSSITADIDKIENKINELNKKYEEAQKKLLSIGSGNISGKDVTLVDNAEFQKLSQKVSELKNQFDVLKTHMRFLDAYTISTDMFFELQSQVETTTAKVSDLIKEVSRLSSDVGFTDGLSWGLEDLKKKVSEVFEEINKSKKKLNNGNDVVDKNSLETIINLFTKIETNLSSIKSVLVDVGDGEELSPLLKTIDNINTSIINLSSSIKNIGLNMNIDVGTNSESEAKIQSKMSNALQAYQRLFEHIKMSSVGGSAITDKFFQFDINQFDTMMSKIQAYRKFIENMRNETKAFFGGKDIIYNDTEKKYWTQAASAMGQLTKAQNELNKTNNTNPLDNLFKNSEDLSGVIEQLTIIVGKLDEISNSAKEFSNIFKTGLNVHASTEEVEKLTAKVKELESELSKIKASTTTPLQESNISSGKKDTFPKTSENLEQVAKSEQKVQQEAVATDKALDNISFTPNTEGFDDIIAKFGILREQAEQITKIVKTTKQTADGISISYKATLRNGSSYYLGESSTPQVLNANETVYDAKAVAKNVEQEARAIQSKWEQAEKAIHNYMNAVTKLNNLKTSDKGTDKKSYEIAGQIEEIEKLKKEAYDARQVLSSMINPHNVDTDTWKRYVDVINRLDQASNGSAESVNRLKDSLKNTLNSELNSLQNSIDKYQNIITQAKTYPSDFKPSTEYNTKLAKLESANEVLKNYKASLQGVNELTKEQQNQINRLTQNCEKAATEFKNLSASEKGTIKVGVEKAIQRINKDLAENTKYSAKAKAGLNALLKQLESGDPSINLRKITEEIIKIENAEIAAGRAGKSLWDIFKTKSTYGFIGQMQSYLSMYVGFYGMVNGVKKAVSTITELDTALVDLKKTTAMNENQLENFYYDSNNVAKQMGVTTKEIIDQASAWSRLGYNTAETSTTMAKLSSQFASISPGMSVDESQSGLVSIMKAKLYALIYSNVYLEYI